MAVPPFTSRFCSPLLTDPPPRVAFTCSLITLIRKIAMKWLPFSFLNFSCTSGNLELESADSMCRGTLELYLGEPNVAIRRRRSCLLIRRLGTLIPPHPGRSLLFILRHCCRPYPCRRIPPAPTRVSISTARCTARLFPAHPPLQILLHQIAVLLQAYPILGGGGGQKLQPCHQFAPWMNSCLYFLLGSAPFFQWRLPLLLPQDCRHPTAVCLRLLLMTLSSPRLLALSILRCRPWIRLSDTATAWKRQQSFPGTCLTIMDLSRSSGGDHCSGGGRGMVRPQDWGWKATPPPNSSDLPGMRRYSSRR
jgi:hypothetical protein